MGSIPVKALYDCISHPGYKGQLMQYLNKTNLNSEPFGTPIVCDEIRLTLYLLFEYSALCYTNYFLNNCNVESFRHIIFKCI